MSNVENLRSENVARKGDGSDVPRHVASNRDNTKSRIPLAPILITLGTVAVAASLVWAMWEAYMAAPWTRDGTVRVYVVTMAPEVAGRIIKLPVADNQFVHKGDELFEIGSLFSDYLIYVTDNRAIAGVWLMFAADSFVATLLAFRMSSAASAATVASSIQPAR